MEMLEQVLGRIDDIVWGPILLVLLVGTGIMLTVRLKGLQLTKLPKAIQLIFHSENKGSGDISSFSALCTALSATIGTGNIVGVATAIGAGGPGALFWMWIAALFGMATKYAECLLSRKYRTIDANGQVSGGPMYYIENGLGKKWKPLAVVFAVFGILVALMGIGTFTQVNSIASSIQGVFGVDPKITSIIVGVLVAIVVFGGIQSISKVAEKVVPFMAILYIVLTLIIICANISQLGAAFAAVIKGAFTGTAAVGGFAGATIAQAIQKGVARGVFSNESGLGSAPIAAAASKAEYPAEQGLVSMTGTFIDTIIICTLTGLSIIITNSWNVVDAEGNLLKGAAVTQRAFEQVLGGVGPYLIMICLSLFAFTTIMGWCYYGERCLEYLAGVKAIKYYRVLYVILVACTGFLQIEVIWTIADIVNGLMAFPNLIALIGLSGVVVKETQIYFDYLKEQEKQKGKMSQQAIEK